MEQINIVYIDDSPEAELGRYLDGYNEDDYAYSYRDIVFNPEEGYESLLNNRLVQEANIIIIDSRLFENKTAAYGKFSGEEFKLVIKKMYPFIETIVITQNPIEPGLSMVKKYDPRKEENAQNYYGRVLPSIIKNAVDNIIQFRRLAEKIKSNDIWEAVLKEKILNTLEGHKMYDELTKTDLDTIILAFKEIQERLDG